MDETVGKCKWQKQSVNGRTVCKRHKQSVIFTDYSIIIVCKWMKQDETVCKHKQSETVCKWQKQSVNISDNV